MLGKLSIIGVVAAILMIPTDSVRCNQHSPHGENLANNLFASFCDNRRPIIALGTSIFDQAQKVF